MTDLLSQSAEGGSSAPPLLVVWGAGGIGKTTFALKHAKSAAVLALEVGARSVRGTRVFPKEGVIQSWGEAKLYLEELAYKSHDFRTVVIDSFSPWEAMLVAHVVKAHGKSSYEKMGWGKEIPVVAELRATLALLELMKYKGIQVIIIAHEKRSTVKDPIIGDYGVFTGSTQIKETWQALYEWADIVGYCQAPFLASEGKQVQVQGPRKLHTIAGAGFQAKQRYGYELASPVPLDWRAFSDALAAGADTAEMVKARIDALLAEMPEHAEKAAQYVADAGADLHALREIENALQIKKEEKQ